MATTAEGRRRRKNRSKKNRTDAGATTTVLDLPDHLFEHILLRLGPSPCLVRAAAACRRWCRVVADAGFLARIRSTHQHAISVGDYHNHIFNDQDEPPVFVPFPASPAAPSAIDVRRFILDFLPDVGKDHYWEMADCRGSLLLLSTWTKRYFHELLVCEPLTRRRRQGILLPPDFLFSLGMFLVDCDDADSQLGMSNFRVIGAVDKTLACVFSPGSDGGWRPVHSEATSKAYLPWSFCQDNFVGRVNGCVYWGLEEGGGTEVLVLDETTAKYSMVKFPKEIWGSYVRYKCVSWIIGGEVGILRIVRLVGNDLKIFAQQHSCSQDGHDDNQWILEKELIGLVQATVGLPGREESFLEHGVTIVAANEEYILLT